MMEGALDVTLQNLGESAGRLAREHLWRRGHLSELAHTLVFGLAERGEAATPRTLLGAAAALLAEQEASLFAADDRLALVRSLLREAAVLFGTPVTATQLAGGPTAPPERARTAYVRNPLSDEAYVRLSPLLQAPTVAYRQSFRELLDDVENGYADYAVLPLFSGREPITSVFELIEERSLAITAAAPIPSGDGEVVFALVAREPIVHLAPTHFLFRCAFGTDAELAVLLAVLPGLGMSVKRVDAAPLPYGEGGLSCRLLLTGDGEALLLTLAYLSLYLPGFTCHGAYIQLS